MPKHYEALQRAEQERRRKVSGAEVAVPAPVARTDTPIASSSALVNVKVEGRLLA